MNTITIHTININNLKEPESEILNTITTHYRNKYERAKVKRVKKQELCAGYLLYKYLGVTSDEQLTFNEYGKPMLKNGEKEFSLSHSGDYVILAVSDNPVGADIERIARVKPDVLKRVLPPIYYEKVVNDASGEEKQMILAKSWTSVEAIIKAEGKGFHIDPREDEAFMDGWNIENFCYAEDYVISVASKEMFTFIINEHN